MKEIGTRRLCKRGSRGICRKVVKERKEREEATRDFMEIEEELARF
jgi:hypothetical protein